MTSSHTKEVVPEQNPKSIPQFANKTLSPIRPPNLTQIRIPRIRNRNAVQLAPLIIATVVIPETAPGHRVGPDGRRVGVEAVAEDVAVARVVVGVAAVAGPAGADTVVDAAGLADDVRKGVSEEGEEGC